MMYCWKSCNVPSDGNWHRYWKGIGVSKKMNSNKTRGIFDRIVSAFTLSRHGIVNTLTYSFANNTHTHTHTLDAIGTTNPDADLAYDATLEVWATTLAMRKKNKEIEGHIQRVTQMTVDLARTMGFSEQDLMHVRRGEMLHDIGEMFIPEAILQKIGPLSPDERKVMRKHPTYAYEMLSPIKYLQPALDIPYCHHERWDGTGYPRGLVAEQIPLAARIFSVVDVWDALRSDRPYRTAWSADEVKRYLLAQAGTEFDPAVIAAFCK
jgi:HD-GYP domain-containing protein (c-di-GMP phosphodiesterase class II)